MQNNNLYITDPKLQEWSSRWPSVDKIYAGNRLAAGIDSQGNLRYVSHEAYFRDQYWHNLIMLSTDKYHLGVVLGLKSDGTCVVAKYPFAGWGSYSVRSRDTDLGNNGFGAMLFYIHS